LNLVIDIGNSFTKLALFRADDIVFSDRIEKFTAIYMTSILSSYPVEQCIVSAVGRFNKKSFNSLRKKVPVLYFSSSTPIPIKNCYTTPNTLGVDRLAAAVGANSLYPSRNVLSIDSGTAITYDLVNSEGEYIGGAISLGIVTRFRALHHYTAKLPEVTFSDSFKVVGTTTQESILSGVMNGIINEVDGYINSVRDIYNDLVVIFTGGDAFFFEKKLKNSIFVHPNLVLLGLNRILNHNAKH